MAGGGGAAALALSSPWRSLLQRALDANAHLKHSTFFQLATVGGGGRPSNRTVVFRGFQEHCDKIQINTDARSNKIGEIRNCPFGEICWYFTETWEQFRISGFIDVIDSSSPEPVKLQVRAEEGRFCIGAVVCRNVKCRRNGCITVWHTLGFVGTKRLLYLFSLG
ncbi:hypothetical protein ABZP36_004675 [Zizania latifolia]